jgi:hypothetical protein
VNLIRRKIAWAKSNPLFWANIGLGFATAYVLFLWKHKAGDDSFFRYWSLALQLIGAATVWHDLAGSARDFGAAAILRRNWAWLKAGFGFPTVISVSARAGSASSTGAAAAVTVRVAPGTSTEERLAALEAHIHRLDDKSAQAFNMIEQKSREAVTKIQDAKSEVMREVSATNERLKGALTGNYPLLAFGSFWLVVGILFSSLIPELSKIGTDQDPLPPHVQPMHARPDGLIKS